MFGRQPSSGISRKWNHFSMSKLHATGNVSSVLTPQQLHQMPRDICLGVDLELRRMDQGRTGLLLAHDGHRKLFLHLQSIQMAEILCKVTFSEHDSEMTKNGKVIGRGIRKKGLYVMKLGNKPKGQICLATINENSTLWHRRLGHVNMRLIQSLASKELVRNLPKLKFDQHFYDACKIGKQAHSYGGNCYTLVIVDDYFRKIEESLNVTFDETPPPSKTSPLVDDDLDEEEAIREIEKKKLENVVKDEALEIDEIVNIKESRNHPLENVIGNLGQRTLRSQAQNQSNFYCFISTIEPKNVNEALGDERTKWVFRNKLDENGIVSQNKARLVAQGYNQQEGINYNETYTPVARLESIRILLAYACALDFKLFQMDVKSAFLKDSVMSDLDELGVTYTEVSSPFEGLSDIRSPRADDHEYLELLGMPEDPYVEADLQAPPSPDYVPSPEEPEQAPPLPDYVPESDPEADPEEDDNEDPEEDPVDYLADGGDDGDDEEGSSEDDEDDDVDMEADEDEDEEEHSAPADSVVVALPAADQAPSAEETEPVCHDFRISLPPSSPLSPWSSPLPQIPSPSLPLSPPSPVLSPAPPLNPICSLVYRAAMTWMRAEAASTSRSLPLPPPFILSPTRSDAPSSGIPPPLPISVPTSSPPLLLPSASRRGDRPEVTLPPQKRLGIALGPRYEVGESSSTVAARPAGGLRADYGFVATMDREIRRDPEGEVGCPFETRVRQDTDEIYTRLDDEQSQRQLLAGRLNMLFRDRRAHTYTRHQIGTKARLSREAWKRSMDASDLACGEVMSLRTTVLGQMSEIKELHAADRRRQAVISEMLKADHRRSAKMRELRTGQVAALQGQVTTLQGQQGPAGGPAQPELPEEAGSSS
ncbi:putative reverse transcriptase domain-containing protein [Tanacetum coccineum]